MPSTDGSLTADSAPSPFQLNQNSLGSASLGSLHSHFQPHIGAQRLGTHDGVRSQHPMSQRQADVQAPHTQYASPLDLDSFSLGGDFSGLDDLSIFTNATPQDTSATTAYQASPSLGSSNGTGGSGSGNKALNATSRFTQQHHRSSSASSRGQSNFRSGSRGGSTSGRNQSSANSPTLMSFSPAPLSERVMQSANASGQPSPMGSGTHGNFDNIGASGSSTTLDNSANASTQGQAATTFASQSGDVSLNDLQSLLLSLQNSQSSHQPQEPHNGQGNNVSIGELEKLIAEKEQFEQMQNQQTAFLRQQLHALQRQQQGMQQQQHLQQSQQHAQHSHQTSASTSDGGHGGAQHMFGGLNATQLMQQYEQLNAVQQGGQFSSAPPTSGAGAPSNVNQLQSMLQQLKSAGDVTVPALMQQYGIYTPVPSGGFQHGRSGSKGDLVSPLNIPSGPQSGSLDQHRLSDVNFGSSAFTPLESPAITPASVFSNAGSYATTTADIFSPLTSPALRPQFDGMGIAMSPFYGPTQVRSHPRVGRHTPNASPAGPQPTKSVPRKNRSTTAEARANRARPSPLIKPVANPPPVTSQRKRTESVSGSSSSPLGGTLASGAVSHSRRGSQSETVSLKHDQQGSGKSSSDAGVSTPSPIEMPPPNGKPMTPSSIMGIKPKPAEGKTVNGSATSGTATAAQPNLRPASMPVKSKEGESSKTVSFANTPQSPDTLQNILPGGLSKAEREAWVSSMKSSGGLESRRTSHKAAEQKRRDSLKFCFDDLRNMLPPITLDDDVPGGSMLGPDGLVEDQEEEQFALEEIGDAESARIANRAISKVALLRHSNEYLMRLKHRIMRRDRDLTAMRRENLELRARLGLAAPIEAPFWIAMGVGPSPPADVHGLVDQYARVHMQQQIQMQIQMGHISQLDELGGMGNGPASSAMATSMSAGGAHASLPPAIMSASGPDHHHAHASSSSYGNDGGPLSAMDTS